MVEHNPNTEYGARSEMLRKKECKWHWLNTVVSGEHSDTEDRKARHRCYAVGQNTGEATA